MRVLVVKTSSMGDVLHTLPALTDAARAHPGIVFDWVVEEGFAAIPAWHPAVARVIPVALRRWRKAPLAALGSGEWRAYRRALKQERYDAVIDAQGLLKSALAVTWAARGPRFGLDAASAREPLAARFYDRRVNVPKGSHAVERVRRLFAAALGYAAPATPGDFGIAGRFAAPSGEPYLVFLHGTTRPDKHWPDGHWAELARIAGAAGWPVRLFWSNEAEKQRAGRLAAAAANVTVLPRLPLEEVARHLAGAAGVVSVDTGLSHLAAALARPNVTLFGPTDPALVGGYGPNQRSLLSREHARGGSARPDDLALLSPGIAWEALAPLLPAAPCLSGR